MGADRHEDGRGADGSMFGDPNSSNSENDSTVLATLELSLWWYSWTDYAGPVLRSTWAMPQSLEP